MKTKKPNRRADLWKKSPPGKPVFSTRVDDENPVHVRLTVFNRGGNAGQLCVNTADAELLITRIGGQHETPAD